MGYLDGEETKPIVAATLRALPTPQPDAEIVALLEELLVRAKSGEILGIAIASHVPGLSTASGFVIGRYGDVAHLVTAIERVKLRLLDYRGDANG